MVKTQAQLCELALGSWPIHSHISTDSIRGGLPRPPGEAPLVTSLPTS